MMLDTDDLETFIPLREGQTVKCSHPPSRSVHKEIAIGLLKDIPQTLSVYCCLECGEIQAYSSWDRTDFGPRECKIGWADAND